MTLQTSLSRIALGTVGLAFAAGAAQADGVDARRGGIHTHGPGFLLSCENGRNYPVRPIAISQEGDMVTGVLGTGRGGVHVRLMPMGDGYRYAGRGIWFDGLRNAAVLNWGTLHAVNCLVTYG